MTIGALIASIRTDPVETIKVLLHCIEEVLARDDRIGCSTELRTRIRIQINVVASVILKRQVVTVLALFALLANASLEVGAKRLLCIN